MDKQLVAYPYNGTLLSIKGGKLPIYKTAQMKLTDIRLREMSHTVRPVGSHLHATWQQATLTSADGAGALVAWVGGWGGGGLSKQGPEGMFWGEGSIMLSGLG